MLRNNQSQALDIVIKNNFNNGIISHATGTGKSITGLSIIKEYNKLFPKNNVYWICEHKFILVELFNNPNFRELFNTFNSNYNILNFSQDKKRNWYQIINDSSKPVFVIINRSFLVSQEKYKKIIKNIDFIIHDECHSIKNKTTTEFYNYIKVNHNYKVIGLSATPYIQYYPFTNILHKYSL